MNEEAYSNEELARLPSEAQPERGEVCLKCGTYIPRFKDLSAEDERQLNQLMKAGNKGRAMIQLHELTGCSLSWAKIWVLHPYGKYGSEPPTPCPFCNETLRVSTAKQCRFCRRDWHDPDNVTFF